MSNESKNNENTSDETSKPAPPKALSEADFLAQEQAHAKDALRAVVADMGRALKDGANFREWTRQYPWLVTAGAAAGGFVTGLLLTPSKDTAFKDFLKEKWESLKPADEPKPTDRATPQPEKPSFVSTLLSEVIKSAGPIIASILSAKNADNNAQNGPETGNGHHAPPHDAPVA